MKHNNVIPSGHFRKHWQNYVRTWFNQPARKTRRRVARQKKAVKIFPRPTAGPLRPIVHGQTLKYNMKVRAGRGFSLEELKAAGIPKKLAPTIGISVDHRRRNSSLEGLQTNVQRLKTYKAKLVIFPRRSKKVKVSKEAVYICWVMNIFMTSLKTFVDRNLTEPSCLQAGDSSAEELATATQVQGPYLPITREKPSVELVKVTDEMKSFKAYDKLRIERTNKRHLGARQKRAAEAEKEDKK
nr:60S ribosomal protein L13-1-like [Ipomoea batatas]